MAETNQGDLFSVPAVPPSDPATGGRHPATSHEAEETVRPHAQADRERIENLISTTLNHGATCQEVEDMLHMPHQTASARISGLRKLGILVDSGRTRKTRSGCRAIVWVHRDTEG